MKILQICYVYPPSYSGYGKQLETLNSKLVEKSAINEVTVITQFDGKRSTKGCRVLGLFSQNRDSYVGKFFNVYLFSLLYPFIFIKELLRCDIIHVVKAGPEALVAVFIGSLLRKPVIIKVAQDEMQKCRSRKFIKRWLTSVRQYVICRMAHIVSISDSITNDIKMHFSKVDYTFIPNSVDIERYSLLSISQSQFRNASQAVNFLYVGSICKRKGLDDLCKALEAVETSRRLHFTFVGPIYSDLWDFEKKLKGLKLNANITVSYFGSTLDVSSFYKTNDFLILPSYSEGMPNVVLESLSCGMLPILSDIPVHKMLVDIHDGILFEVGNLGDLASKIEEASNLPTGVHQRSEQLHKSVRKVHSLDVIANSYAELYSRLFNNV